MVRHATLAAALFLSPMSMLDASAAEETMAASSTPSPVRIAASLVLFSALILGAKRRESDESAVI